MRHASSSMSARRKVEQARSRLEDALINQNLFFLKKQVLFSKVQLNRAPEQA